MILNSSLFKSKTFFLIFIFIILSKNYSFSQDKDLVNLKDSINKYYYSFDSKKLKRILADADKCVIDFEDNYYAHYFNGIIRYCIGRVLYNVDSDEAYNYFDTALDMFDKAYSIDKNPVALAMVSAAYGKKSALSPLRAIFFGQKAKNRIYDAYNADSMNPKIIIVAATHLMHVPGIYGGDKKKSRRLLEKCLEINKKNNFSNSMELDWAGNAEIYAYLAQLDILEDKIDSARYNMKKALELKPNYGFILIDLENQINNK